MIRDQLDRVGARVPRVANSLVRWNPRATPPRVAHHGLQRSGTNVLRTALSDLGVTPLNAYDRPRNHPQHKHFRWQADASTIVMDPAFLNDVVAGDLDAVDRLAGYPAGTRHVVVYKPATPWARSIINWGLRCGWWADLDAAVAALPGALGEYDAYNEFWQRMERDRPGECRLVEHPSVATEAQVLLGALDDLGVPVDARRRERFTGVHRTVAQSPADRTDVVDATAARAIDEAVASRTFMFDRA
jgi:hypothetical protein